MDAIYEWLVLLRCCWSFFYNTSAAVASGMVVAGDVAIADVKDVGCFPVVDGIMSFKVVLMYFDV